MTKRFPMYFTNGKHGELIIPQELTQTEFDLLKQQIDNALWVAREAFIQAPRIEPEAAQEVKGK